MVARKGWVWMGGVGGKRGKDAFSFGSNEWNEVDSLFLNKDTQ